jgi:hypothetical protein
VIAFFVIDLFAVDCLRGRSGGALRGDKARVSIHRGGLTWEKKGMMETAGQKGRKKSRQQTNKQTNTQQV